MKKAMAVAALALAVMSVAQAQEVAGDWMGTLETGMGDFRVVLHITKSAAGILTATMDSPDQGIGGMAVVPITLEGTKLKFTVTDAKGSYEGTIKNAGTIAGNWSQPKKIPLEFKKTTTPPKLDHPPAPPSDIDGTWEGYVDGLHGRVRVLFHIKNTGDGLTAAMDNPDQNFKGWPATKVTRNGASLTIEMQQLESTFRGKINKDLNRVSGDWHHEGDDPMTLKRLKEEPSDSQKQTPTPAPAKN
jgi:hypothetical protein